MNTTPDESHDANIAKEFDATFQPATTKGWRFAVFRVIFLHEKPLERRFDLTLIVLIFLSIIVTIADSEDFLHVKYADAFLLAEWVFTIVFTIEYVLRILVVKRPWNYIRSFFGVIDLLSILPTYLSLFFVGAQYLLVIRVFRILRVFRVLKLIRYMDEAGTLLDALVGAKRKILVFVAAVMTVVVIFGALMYLIEGPEHGFHSIPEGMYWAIVTMATVGFGDISPQTGLGRLLTSVLILIGYAIIAVPTGIYTAELHKTMKDKRVPLVCSRCGLEEHDEHANFCHRCGERLPELIP